MRERTTATAAKSRRTVQRERFTGVPRASTLPNTFGIAVTPEEGSTRGSI